jgi:NifU-like protein
MSKDDLIGKGLWEAYSQKVHDHMNNPRHRGSFTDKDASAQGLKLIVADYGDASCGDSIQLFWLVDEKTNIIRDAKFLSFGCGTAIASADMMVELTIGRTVDEAAKITNLDVERSLRDKPETPAFPGQKMHCSVMAYDVIKRAIAQYQGIDINEIENQEIVCPCAQVTLGTIVDAIVINDLKTVEEITHYTKAGGFCKSCIRPGGHEPRKYYLEDILRDTREKIANGFFDRQKKFAPGPNAPRVPFESLPKAKQLKVLEDVIEKYVNPILAKDRGGVELADMEGFTVKIIYQGACLSCESAAGMTLRMIEGILKDKVDERLKVEQY